jgi:hypothetical protein
MSIQWGGDFDIGGRWDQRVHEFHRVGLSVDIDNYGGGLRVPDQNNPRRGVWTPKGRKLNEFMQKHSGRPNQERKIHFGFDGGS